MSKPTPTPRGPRPRAPRPRARGIRIGTLEPGPENAITDVPGVAIGHVTVWRDEPEPPAGRGVARTGVTTILPGPAATLFDRPVPAGAAVLNGAGELTGFLQISEWGVIETPIYLTSTMAVGRVFDGAVTAACAADQRVGVDDVVIPVVGECDDSWLSDPRTVQVERDDVARALRETTTGSVAEGCVGAGTGMMTFDWKAGIGTASRTLCNLDATVGVLVLANFGVANQLRVDGVPVGRTLDPASQARAKPAGSCIVVVATDAPLTPRQLERVARRAGLGLARTGSVAHHGSGEIFVAFSTHRYPREAEASRITIQSVPDASLDAHFAATVEATEEAVVNALWAAVDTVGRDGRFVPALPHDAVLELLEASGRLQSPA
jgi:D-aminopeptidase